MFTNHWAQAGLVDGYWSTDVKYVKLEPGIEYTFALTRHVMKRLNLHQKCLEQNEVRVQNYNFFECIDNAIQKLLQEEVSTKKQKLCWIPQADYFIRLMNLTSIEACQTTAEMEALSHALIHAMSNGSRSKECIPVCSVSYFGIKVGESLIHQPGEENTSEIYIQWEDININVQEEYELMDLNAILSAVGGSLGLFLGFSCLQVLLQLLQKLEEAFH